MEKEKIKMSSKLWEDRAKSSLLFIPSDSIVKQLSIDEMGVNIYITPTNAVVSRNFAMNVFPNMGDDGISRPYIFLSDFVDTWLKYEGKFDEATELEKTIIENVKKYIYILSEPHFAVGTDPLTALSSYIMYASMAAKGNVLIDDIKGLSVFEILNKYITILRAISIGGLIADYGHDKSVELAEEIETAAFEKVKQFVSDNKLSADFSPFLEEENL